VVWFRGEHDLTTRLDLSVTIARAARIDGADVAIDLSGVTFMDASTISALVVARDRLRADSQSMSVRAPSPCARRLLEICGLEGAIDESPSSPQSSRTPALNSWVAVPASDRLSNATHTSDAEQAPSREPPLPAGALHRPVPESVVQRHRSSP
jgi:anti-anti-sigma factor